MKKVFVKTNNVTSIPKHHRKQISKWLNNGELENYKETDVILYKDKNNKKQGLKTTYEKVFPDFWSSNNPTDINEISTIEGLLEKKGILYKRRSTFNQRTGENINWKSFYRGIKTSDAQWIDADKWLHCRIQSNPEQIVNSILHQQGILNVKIHFVELPSNKYGNYFMQNGMPNIEINKNLNFSQFFKTTIHESTHLIDDKKIIEYLSLQLKNKTEQEIIKYTSKHDDELSYIYKKYSSGFYGDKNKIRKIAYEQKININETEINKLINANKNYTPASKNYNTYKNNFLENHSFAQEIKTQNQMTFYTDDYNRIFTPDVIDNDITTFL